MKEETFAVEVLKSILKHMEKYKKEFIKMRVDRPSYRNSNGVERRHINDDWEIWTFRIKCVDNLLSRKEFNRVIDKSIPELKDAIRLLETPAIVRDNQATTNTINKGGSNEK